MALFGASKNNQYVFSSTAKKENGTSEKKIATPSRYDLNFIIFLVFKSDFNSTSFFCGDDILLGNKLSELPFTCFPNSGSDSRKFSINLMDFFWLLLVNTKVTD